MIGERIEIWKENEYSYPAAHGFIPIMVSYIHEDAMLRPAMLVIPGGAYMHVSSTEGDPAAAKFYKMGYNTFVLAYTADLLGEAPLKLQPLNDISRAIRIIRSRAEEWNLDPAKVSLCGFSAGGHLCASLCVHGEDIEDPSPEYAQISNRPDAAVLSYPVITSGKYAHRPSIKILLGEDADPKELEYMSLEKHVTKETPPCFLWHTLADATVPAENSFLFAKALKDAGVPFSLHIFPEGVHGMSVATEDWLEGRVGDKYTMEQTRMLGEAIRAGKTDFPPEKGEEILAEFGITKERPEKWSPEVKEKLRKLLPEISVWPDLAGRWLDGVYARREY